MTNTSVLKIDGVEHDHSQIHKLAKQSPDIGVSIGDISIYGCDINSKEFLSDTYSVKTNEFYESNQIVVYRFHDKLILLTGYDKYLSLKESGKETIKVSLISKPVLKRARFEVYVKSVVINKPTYIDRTKDRAHNNDFLALENQATTKPSRQRNIGLN